MADQSHMLEWRAGAKDHGDAVADYGEWHPTRGDAEAELLGFRDADPRYDLMWIEYRHVSAPVLDRQSRREFTHVCVDCGALGVAGGYHDHGGGAAGETIPLTELPKVIRSFQAIESERDELREERQALEDENRRLRELYENALGNRERFGWTINHLLECEEALRTAEAEADRLREALHFYADRRHHHGTGISAVYNDGGRRARQTLGVCPTCVLYGDGFGQVKTVVRAVLVHDPLAEYETCPDCRGAGVALRLVEGRR